MAAFSKTSVFALIVISSSVSAAPGDNLLDARPEVVESWRDMRFGMFLCWGPVSLTGREIGWSRGKPKWGVRPGVRGGRGSTPADVYDNLYKEWRPDKFDAEDWVRLAKDAGMKYMIFLVKHHDGFCLYDTKLTDYKSTGAESAWKVDVMKHVADACHKHDLKLMIYYSQPDWRHPDFLGEHHDRYIEYLHGQVRELLTGYGVIDGLWFDNLRPVHPDTAKLWRAEELFRMARTIQPDIIINNRCGLPGDYDTPEQSIGGFEFERPWESCVTLGTQWSWKPDDTIKPLEECIDILVTCAGRGGNLALNTNPMPDGRIEARQAERFRQIGAWLKKYGESIYGTRGGPYVMKAWGTRFGHTNRSSAPQRRPWGVTTWKDKSLFVHVLNWDRDVIELPPINRKLVSYRSLTGPAATVVATDESLAISVPAEDRHGLDTIVELVFDRSLGRIDPIFAGKRSLALGCEATASGVWPEPRLEAALAFDGDPQTRWGGAPDSKDGWLVVDLARARTLDSVWISEAYDRIRRFELQEKTNGGWRTFYEGTTVGEDFNAAFEPVTARYIRLNILAATDVPTIWEVQFFADDKGSRPQPRRREVADKPDSISSASKSNPFFALCMDTHDSQKRTLKEQAQLLHELGYDGAGHLWLKDVGERLKTLDAVGLKLFQIYISVNIASSAKEAYDPDLRNIAPLLKGRDTALVLLINGCRPSDQAGDRRAVDIVREISALAARYGLKVVLYPHTNYWLERVEDGLRLAEKVDRANVGVMFNLCHWLKVDEEKNLASLLTRALPHLSAVSIHGADTAADIKSGKGNWIQPLDSGAYDVESLLKTLSQLGYRGPVGLQCYGIGGDARDHLARSIKAWRSMRPVDARP